MDWLEVLRKVRVARADAMSGAPPIQGTVTAETTDDVYSIRIIGYIDWLWGVDVLPIAEYLLEQRPSAVSLYLDSGGGDLFDAMALRAALDSVIESGTRVTAQAGSIVASAAVPVYLTGTTRSAQTYSRFMVHNPRALMLLGGTLADMESTMDDIRGMMSAATGLYWESIATHVGAIANEWRDANQDVWLTAAEATERGVMTGDEPDPDVTAVANAERERLVSANAGAVLSGLARHYGTR